jgi:glycosyltransferase involved in cell wall biosynthesis
MSVDFECDVKYNRDYFQLPKSKFCFIFSYDLYSYSARKNPEAVLAAFTKAFSQDDDRVRLVIKVNHADKNPKDYELLLNMAQIDPRILLITNTLSRDEMYGLLNSGDCYVSLHRAEGFGLGLAESMFLGKPVIGTAYSGNMDFMSSENSCLVDFKIIPVSKDAYPYWKGQWWADPNIETAALHMKRLVNDTDFRTRIGELGKATIRTSHSSHAVGKLISKRLDEIRNFL